MHSPMPAAHAGVSRPRPPSHALKVIRHALGLAPLWIAAFIVLVPVWWTVMSSLRSPAESFTLPPQWLPLHPDWSNYQDVFKKIPYGTYVHYLCTF